jgi:hypothetical protein
VPFELGRPFGAPNDPVFQKRVLLAVLELLEATDGPVLEDFPEDAPVSGDRISELACPVSFPQKRAEPSETGQLCEAFRREMASMSPWYDLSVSKRGRTTVGVSGFGMDAVADFICAFIEGGTLENPHRDISLAYALNLATDDLKAYYFEGITAQPGQESPSSDVVTNWFWQETIAAKVLREVRKAGMKSEDPEMRRVAAVLIVPTSQL